MALARRAISRPGCPAGPSLLGTTARQLATTSRRPQAQGYGHCRVPDKGRFKPLFPFGHGLSYTSFAVSSPRLSAAQIARGDRFSVDVDVTNTGRRAGDEVVQLYIRDQASSAPRPVLELKAFRRISLKPGEKQAVRFDLGPDDLAF
ncbi:MAG: fibronectin type III-like domain-contianing protein [Novosphingobium sp.]